MKMRLYWKAMSPAAIVILMLAEPSTTNAQIAEKPENVAHVFDPDALAQTLKELKSRTTVDLFGTSLKVILDMISKRHRLKLKIEATGATLVTIKTPEQSLGKVLTELLATVNCEYAIFPNGVIVVRESFNKSTGKRDKTALP